MAHLKGQGKTFIFPVFIMGSFCITILAGLLGTLLPSLNYLPVIGHTQISLKPWLDFFSYPGIKTSIRVTLFSGLATSFGVVSLAFLFISFFYGNALWKFFEKILSPVLSIPHAAFAIGFGFLIAPSGWLVRMVSPGMTGFVYPPDWVFLNDPEGVSLAIGLVIKEFPFLIMVAMGALGQLEIEKTILAGKALGYQKEQVWLKILIPRLYPHLRLSIFAIIAYSLSVVDMAIILGPSSPPTLAVLILKWFNDPDVNFKLMAAAGSLFLFSMVGLSILFVFFMERAVCFFLRFRITNGKRRSFPARFKSIVFFMVAGIIFFTGAASVVLVIWSVTWRWQFPDVFPIVWTLKLWAKGLASSFDPVMTTVITGMASAFIGLVLTIGCLEHDADSKKNQTLNYNTYIHYFLYLPLLIPQITFMAGIQLSLVILGMDGYWITLVWSHLLFVLPYMFISLSATYRAYDTRFTDQAMLLKRSYPSVLFRVKLPMLLKPVLFSFAIGFCVSVAQYIPTMLVGAGRFSTITTQVVNLASGSDRRAIAVYALIQQSLAMIIYAVAVISPKILYYNKKGMQV
ncbi:MAG: ABC transporter permease [Deltaproteobacteria bacterium]|nr:ABC transporter permease [Deltaproteobacteria bacterium]